MNRLLVASLCCFALACNRRHTAELEAARCHRHCATDGGAPDLAASVGAPMLTGVDPASGPAGTVLVVSGSGFQAGDVVQLSGNGFAITLAALSLTSSAILALAPTLPSLPTSGQVRVVRGSAASAGAPFQETAGQVFYLAPGGSDAADGSAAAPWATITAAAQKMAPGDLAYLHGGTYVGEVEIDVSGSPTAPLTFRAFPGESPLLQAPSTSAINRAALTLVGSYLAIYGLRVSELYSPGQGVLFASSASHDTLSGCDVFGAPSQGVMLSGHDNLVVGNRIHDGGTNPYFSHGVYVEGANNVLRGNLIFNNMMNGIQIYNGYGVTAGGTLVEGNYIFHNGWGSNATDGSHSSAAVLIADGQPNTTVRNNRLCGNAQFGVLVSSGVGGTQVAGNVSCYNGMGGLYLSNPGTGTQVSGNVSYNDGGFALGEVSGVRSDGDDLFAPGLLLRWNDTDLSFDAFRAASGQETNGRVVDPQLRRVGADFSTATVALGYDFCSPLLPAMCSSP